MSEPMKGLSPTGFRSRLAFPALASGVEKGLWLFSLICLATFVWMKADAWRFQREAAADWRRAVAAQTLPSDSSRAGDRSGEGASRPAAAPRRFEPGSPIARLTIPRLDVDVVVAEGTSDSVLQKAVGHLEGTSRPGGDGNVVLAGHRDTFFRPLEGIRAGDRIELDAGEGNRTYLVEWTKVVTPDRIEVAAPTPSPSLTLITCYPFRYIGPAPERYIVRARALEEGEGKGVGPSRATGGGD